MLHACVQTFDVMGTVEIFLGTKAVFSSRKSFGFGTVAVDRITH